MNTFNMLALGGPAADAFAAGAGITAAVLLLGGPILLRLQRQRQQFHLTKAAIDKGVTQLPSGPPAWLQSMRTGVILLALGTSILLCGGVSVVISTKATMPDRTAPSPLDPPIGSRASGSSPMDSMVGSQRRPGGPGGFDRPNDRPPRDMGPGGPPRMQGPGGPQGGPDRDGPPPPPDPAMDLWRQSRAEYAIGVMAIAGGFILAVMGLARLMFARVERRYEGVEI